MNTFKYHSKNLPRLHPTSLSAPCRACGSTDGCETNFDRTVYLCKQVESANHMESLSGWIHHLENLDPTTCRWEHFFDACKRNQNSVVRNELCKYLGVNLAELATYPIGFDPARELAAMPAMADAGVFSGIVLFDVNGPKAPAQFMLQGSQTGATFPIRPPQSGPFVGSLLCSFDLGDAMQAQALGFDTCALTNPFVTDAAAGAVGRYAMTHGFSDIVLVSRPKNPIRNPRVMAQAAKKLHQQSGGLAVFDAEVPEAMANFAAWAHDASFSRGQRLPNERLLVRGSCGASA